MAETYSVTAILSAYDKGFSAAMRNASKSTNALGKTVRGGLGFGILTGIGQQAFNTLAYGARDLIGEISASNAAWKTFNGNMRMIGMGKKEIRAVKNELQDFAEKTIYSSSDMAQTYSQLAAVGTKNCNKLVKGFGGLAAAAENPQQAMKTLSQQATQMAAKPYVAWQDFKLMLEQTPAGIAAVAKEMGMSTSELVKSVQDGTVATEDFFDAIAKVGTNDAFTKLATEYKTVGQAMDGLKETLGNKLTPAFDVLSKKAIGGIDKIINKVSKIDPERLADKVNAAVKKAQPYLDMLKSILSAVGKAFAVVGRFALNHSNALSKIIPAVLLLTLSFKALRKAANIVPHLSKFYKALKGLGGKVISKIAPKLFGVAAAEKAVGKEGKRAVSGTANLKNGLGSLAKSAGIALIVSSLALLAIALKPLASLGSQAVAPLMAFASSLGIVAMVLSAVGNKLQASMTGIIAFAGAVSAMAIAMAPIAQTGIEGAAAMGMFGIVVAGLVAVFGLFGGALNMAIPGMLAFGAAVVLVGAGLRLATPFISAFTSLITACGNAVSIAAESISAGFLKVSEGISIIINAVSGGFVAILNGISNVINSIGISARNAGIGFKLVAQGIQTLAGMSLFDISKSLGAVAIGIGAIATKGKNISVVASGMQRLMSAAAACSARLGVFNAQVLRTVAVLGNAGTAAGNRFANGLNSGTKRAVNIARTDITAISTTLKNGKAGAYSAGRNIGLGLANGMRSTLGVVRSVASQLAAAAQKAIEAKAKIASPSKVTDKLGRFFGEGWVNGMKAKISDAKEVASDLVNIPSLRQMDYAGGFSDDYIFGEAQTIVVEVPVNLDGKEVARIIAPYEKEELNKRERRESRKRGRR